MTEAKKQAALAALPYLNGHKIIGVGTGSTVNYFIDELTAYRQVITGCVASSIATEQRLRALDIPIIDLNQLSELSIYIDGADEVNAARQMIKGGGGALTHEKIIATAAKKFICIVDESKVVKQLGAFPIAIEVLPIARNFVARELVKLGGKPIYREGFVTDNGNDILDLHGVAISSPMALALEEAIKLIPGVVENGLFAKRIADVVLVGK